MVKPPYTSSDLAVLVPTKDRPERIRRLLRSLAAQTDLPGQVLVVDGGRSIEDVVMSFSDRLPVEYYRCVPPGQIRQRKYGIGKIGAGMRLVNFFDDDIELEPEACGRMIAMWNSLEPETAGIGYNIVNAQPHVFRFHYALFMMSSREQGRVLPSGFVTPLGNIREDIRSQWLGGGYTVWRRDILDEFEHEDVNTRWAVGEDVRFSYPIGKQYPLYVCAGARIRDEYVNDYAPPDDVARYQGRKWALAQLYLTSKSPELSVGCCLWMLAGSTLMKFGSGVLRKARPQRQAAIGQAGAIGTYFKRVLLRQDLKSALED